jgi:ferredoxin
MPRKIPVLDLSSCTDCDACLELCPLVFQRNPAGYMEVTPLAVYPEECIQEAINCCPRGCISLEEVE